MISYRHGALAVVEDPRSAAEVNADLRRIDPRLFCEQQVTLAGDVVWCVVVAVGGDIPPVTIHEWRDEQKRPLPLSSGIVREVQRMERDGGKLAAEVIKHNRDLIDSRRQTADTAYREIQDDMMPRMKGTRSAALHRGQHLRRSRDKHRADGEKL
jgi:hypothetical protein